MKFVYFDIGGVMIKDFSATRGWDELTTELGVSKERKSELDKKFNEFEKEACVGRDAEEFLPILEKDFDIKLPENYSILRDFVSRFYRNEGIWEIVAECKKKYGVGLLTDAYPGMFNLTKKSGLLPKIDFLVIDSSVVGYKKPNEEIYKIAQERAGVEASEILFVDNKRINLETAKKLGWKTFWFDSRNYKKSNEELGLFLANKVEF